ncbi:hypothetical protein [Ruegeria jejuensis]|uniref:hypothetical protein n=1 Tax=Ruegeria jejuensis TaxID=3233338 RepID=UPI00355B7F4E
MRYLATVPVLVVLAGCQTPTNIEGVQTYYNGSEVIIDGLQTPTPTDAEHLNAEQGCGGPATFKSSEPAGQGFYRLTFTCD